MSHQLVELNYLLPSGVSRRILNMIQNAFNLTVKHLKDTNLIFPQYLEDKVLTI